MNLRGSDSLYGISRRQRDLSRNPAEAYLYSLDIMQATIWDLEGIFTAGLSWRYKSKNADF